MGQRHNMDLLYDDIIAAHNRFSKETATDFLPNRREVDSITELLRRLVFPGYFEPPGTTARDAQNAVSCIVPEIIYRLERQICRALNMDAGDNSDCGDGQAREICLKFLKKIPHLIEILYDDVSAAYDGDPAARGTGEIIFAYPGIFAISVFRFAHELWLLSVPMIPRIMTEYAHSRTGIDIHPGAEIGRRFFIDHGTGIVIGETTKIGDNVKLYQGVTLGALSTQGGNSLRGKKRHPTIEDEVTIYSGASILGGDTVIGRGSVIGGNVFITRSVPPGSKISLMKSDNVQ